MPTIITHHGKRIVRARVTVQGRTRTKKYPDDSRKSYRAAIQWEEDKKTTLAEEIAAEQTETATESNSILIETWLDKYLTDAQRRFVKGTYQEKQFAFQQLADHPEISKATTVHDLTPEIAWNLVSSIAQARSGNCANKVRKNLARAWKWAKTIWPHTWPQTENPFAAIDKMPAEQTPRYVPPLEDFWKVYQAADSFQDRVMLMVFLQTAARRNEVFNLQFNDLDFEKNLIRLWTRKRVGGMEYDWIPLTATLRRDLLAWIEHRIAMSEVDPDHIFICLEDSPFTKAYYGQPFQQRRHIMKRFCERAGVHPFGFHAIRHLTAVTLYRQGETVATIQGILRHRSANTTARYLKSLGLDLEGSRAALEKMNGPAEIVEMEKQKGKND